MMSDSIVYNRDKKKFIVSPQILEIIENLSKRDMSFKNERKKLTTEFDSFDFKIRMNSIISRAIISLKYLPNEDNEISFDVTKLKDLVQKFEELYPENKREENYHYHFENLSEDVLVALLVVINDSVLSKHSLLNRKKIKKEKKKLRYFTNKNQEEQSKFAEAKAKENASKLNDLNEEIANIKKLIAHNKEESQRLNDQLITLQDNIKTRFKCDTIEQVASKIQESDQFLEQYDISNSVWLIELQYKIEQLNRMIFQQQESLKDVQEEKEVISRGM